MNKEALEALLATLDNWAAFFIALVVIGVGGEFVIHLKQSRVNKKLVALQHSETKAQETEIARLNKDAAELRKTAEDERLARVELESKVAWRRLDSQTQSYAASHLIHFAKEPALVAYNTNDIEASTFASDIAAMLHAAKWDVPEPLAIMKLREGPVPLGTNPPVASGVLVWSTDDEASRKAAAELVKQLSSRGFDISVSAEAKSLLGIHATPTRVVLSVEHKPEGPQGEYKLRTQQNAAP